MTFVDFEPQRPVQDDSAAVWFANGEVVRKDGRARTRGFNEKKIDDSVLRVQDLLQTRVRGLADGNAAVSFARRARDE